MDLALQKTGADAILAIATPCTNLELQTDDEFHDRIRTAKCEWKGFRDLASGRYRVCADGRCTSIVLAESPHEQHFQLP